MTRRCVSYYRRFRFAWTLTREVSRFLDRDHGRRNRWINTPYGKIYIRVSRRSFSQDGYCLDLGSIEIYEPFQRIGLCTVALTVLENQARGRGMNAVFVENVLNDILRDILLSRGYECMQFDPISFFKRTRHQ